MRIVFLTLLVLAFLKGSGAFSDRRIVALRKRIRDWFEETHSTGFELRRHFFRRFFDSELIADPNQAKVLAGGAFAVLVSLALIYAQAYYHKYAWLNGLADPGPYRRAALADFLFVISLGMVLSGLFTTLQWPSLFPGLRDYLALAGLPARMREIFVAKFTALLFFASIMIAGTSALPSAVLPSVMDGRYAEGVILQVPGIFVSGCLAGFFVFFSLVTLQGVLLNLLPVRQFQRVSLAVQGALLAILLCALPMVLYVPNLLPYMDARPPWAVFVPPLWFLGVDQIIAGHSEPLAARLSAIAFASVVLSAASALLVYLWSYRRHRTRVIESSGAAESAPRGREWIAKMADRLFADSRTLAVFGFIGKSLARSRQHRLILTAFGGIALAIISRRLRQYDAPGWRPSPHVRFIPRPSRRPRSPCLWRYLCSRWQACATCSACPSSCAPTGSSGFTSPVIASACWPAPSGSCSIGASFRWPLLTLPPKSPCSARAGLARGAGVPVRLAGLDGAAAVLPGTDSVHLFVFPGQGPAHRHGAQVRGRPRSIVAVLSALIRAALGGPVATLLLLFLLAAGWLRARTARFKVRHIARLSSRSWPIPRSCCWASNAISGWRCRTGARSCDNRILPESKQLRNFLRLEVSSWNYWETVNK